VIAGRCRLLADDKPNSVSRLVRVTEARLTGAGVTAIPLGSPLPTTSSARPVLLPMGPADHGRTPRRSEDCLRLHAVGFAVPRLSPAGRCALTAPFHPCREAEAPLGGLFSVALSLALQPRAGGRYPPPCPVVFGLSSTRPDWSELRPSVRRHQYRTRTRAERFVPSSPQAACGFARPLAIGCRASVPVGITSEKRYPVRLIRAAGLLETSAAGAGKYPHPVH
jgi:hypothetical protein